MSNFHLNRLYIQNFRSIKKVDLEIKDGLYAVVGKNLDQPATFNGAGKSSTVYALWWCLTGNSLGGEALADDVVNIQEGKDCKVECTFDTDKGEVIIMRCRKDKEHGNNLFLTINGQDLSCHKVADTQERINQLLKVNFDVLKSTIILTSDMKSNFADLTPKDRISMLESIRDYTIWEKVRAESNVDIKALDTEIKEYTGLINQSQGSINTYAGLVSDLRVKYLEEKQKVSDENSEEKIKELQEALEKAKKDLSEVGNENYDAIISELDVKIGKKNQEIQDKLIEHNANKDKIREKYKNQNSEINNLISELQTQSSNLEKDIMTIDFDVRNLRSDVDIIQKWFTNDTCPTCNRKLDRTDDEINAKNNQREELLQKIKQKENEKASIKANYLTIETQKIKHKEIIQENEKKCSEELVIADNEYQKSVKNIQDEIETLTADLNNIKSAQKEAKSKTENLNSIISNIQSKIAVMNEQKNSTDNRLNEIKDQAEKYKAEMERLEQEKSVNEAKIKKLEKRKTLAKFFYDALGPKGNFRGGLLAKDIAYINHCLKSYIPKFFECADLYLVPPTAEKNVIDIVFEEDGVVKPVTNLSGGERKRVNLCVALAVYDLLQSTSLFSFNLCVFDEIESALDPEGVRQLLEVIDDRQDNFQTAWWITNNEMVSSNIPNKLVATKQNGFTRIEYK